MLDLHRIVNFLEDRTKILTVFWSVKINNTHRWEFISSLLLIKHISLQNESVASLWDKNGDSFPIYWTICSSDLWKWWITLHKINVSRMSVIFYFYDEIRFCWSSSQKVSIKLVPSTFDLHWKKRWRGGSFSGNFHAIFQENWQFWESPIQP